MYGFPKSGWSGCAGRLGGSLKAQANDGFAGERFAVLGGGLKLPALDTVGGDGGQLIRGGVGLLHGNGTDDLAVGGDVDFYGDDNVAFERVLQGAVDDWFDTLERAWGGNGGDDGRGRVLPFGSGGGEGLIEVHGRE